MTHTRAVHPIMAALRTERKRLNMTQRQLSARTGWATRTIAAAEVGESCPRLDFVADYAAGVGLVLGLSRP
jgi:predicted transcriptional regulator